MKQIDLLIEEFKDKYERFLIGCDAVEEMNLWDKDKYGEMDVFYQNDLVGIILRLITIDGKISDKETEYVNESFDFDYSTEELIEIYDNCRDSIGLSFYEQFKIGLTAMQSINEKLAYAYKQILLLICDIIINSDNIITQEEIQEVERIKDSINS